MKRYFTISNALESKIESLNIEIHNDLKRAKSIIELVNQALGELRSTVLKNGFVCQEDEIFFFKTIKPNVFSKLIYYHDVKEIAHQRILLTQKQLSFYKKNMLKKYQRVFKKSLEFIRYYNEERENMDHMYFVRGTENHLTLDMVCPMCLDSDFSTSYDIIVAHILAHKLIKKYITSETESGPNVKSSLKWSGTKADLVELAYALQSSGAINNGNADVKEIVRQLEQLFNTQAGDLYRTYHEIRARKSDRTKFISQLHNSLNKRMDDADGK